MKKNKFLCPACHLADVIFVQTLVEESYIDNIIGNKIILGETLQDKYLKDGHIECPNCLRQWTREQFLKKINKGL